MNLEKLKAWLCLKNTPELGCKGRLELLRQYPDPMAFVSHPEHELYSSGLLKDATKTHLQIGTLPQDAQRIFKLCDKLDIRFLCLDDPLYPAPLKTISDPPLILYYRGDPEVLNTSLMLAVVGTRKASSYGIQMCRKLLSPACEKGAVVISGLAMGIDTIAHQTALEAGSKTIAVLASGLETIYPPTNKALADRIVANGIIISEYDPGSKMERWNFPDRNRIISALAEAVFVVEGGIDSGAMLTARFAREQGRAVFALPGNINIPNAQGPNLLIKQGAELISGADDLLNLLRTETSVAEQTELFPTLEPEEQTLYDLFRKEQQELSFDTLLLKTGLSFGKLSILLLNLELKSVIAKSSGNSFILL